MKKNILLAALLLLTASCGTSEKLTATQEDITNRIITATVAELDVSDQKVSYTLYPSKEVRKGGTQNCVNVAIQKALESSGGDVLVETHKAIIKKHGFCSSKVLSVTVSGYPAKYKNFRPVTGTEVFNAYRNTDEYEDYGKGGGNNHVKKLLKMMKKKNK